MKVLAMPLFRNSAISFANAHVFHYPLSIIQSQLLPLPQRSLRITSYLYCTNPAFK